MPSLSRNFLPSLTAALAIGNASAVTVIYQDDFSGGTANLDGASPDIGTGTWEAAAPFDRNGDVNITNGGAGSATLSFAPVDGLTYTLEASITISSGGAGDWVGFGFANNQSNTTGTSYRFLSNNVVEGRAWMFARENTNNPSAQLTGNDNGATWVGITQSPSDLDMRVILDTTGGAGTWTATWFAKAASDPSFTQVRATTLLDDEDITSVGFAVSGSNVSADLNSFSLTSVPEPSVFTLLAGLAGIGLLRRHRV